MKDLKQTITSLFTPTKAVFGPVCVAIALLAAPGCNELPMHGDTMQGESTDGTGDESGDAAEGQDEGGNASSEGGDAGMSSGPASESSESGDEESGEASGEAESGGSSEPFERFVGFEVTADGMYVTFLPGSELQAAMPFAAEVSVLLPGDPDAAAQVAVVDLDGMQRFTVSAQQDTNAIVEGTTGSRIEFGDYRVTPKPTNCTFPPCPGEGSETGFMVDYEQDAVRWRVGEVEGVPFGFGLALVDGEEVVVPYAAAVQLSGTQQEQLNVARIVLDDVSELFEAPVGSLPPETTGWPSWCDVGKTFLKGAVTAGQAACCANSFGTACVACAFGGEGAKDAVDSIDCD